MTDDSQGRLYICDFGKGLRILDTKTGEQQLISMNNNNPTLGTLCNDWIKSLFVDRYGMHNVFNNVSSCNILHICTLVSCN